MLPAQPEPEPAAPGPEPAPPSGSGPEPEPDTGEEGTGDGAPQDEALPEPNPSPGPPPPDPDSVPEPGTGSGAGSGELESPIECGFGDVGCHVSAWFADLVVGALNPLFAWVASVAFRVPLPSEGVEGLWAGVLTVANLLFVLLVLAGGGLLMGHHTVQTRYGLGEVLGRLVFAFIACNASLWIAKELFTAANGISRGIGALGLDPVEAAENMRERMQVLLMEGVAFTVLLLVALVVGLVVWVIADVVRTVMSIVLVIAAPLLLCFHALPQTNRLAALWWRSMAGLCAMPIAQCLAFIVMMKLFFEGQMSLYGHMVPDVPDAVALLGAPTGDARPEEGDSEAGGTALYDLVLFLVVVYIQIRVPFWVMKLVWSPHPGSSPVMTAAKAAAAVLLFKTLRNLSFTRKPSTGLGPPGGSGMLRAHLTPLRRRLPRLGGPGAAGAPGGPLPPGPSGPSGPSGGVDRVRPSIWWYRPRPEHRGAAGELGTGRKELPPGDVPRGLPGPRGLGGPPPPRPHGTNPARGRLGDGSTPKRPRSEQQELFRPAPPPTKKSEASGHRRRWRQGVLPIPPPERAPGRRGAKRLGEVFDAPVKGPERPVRPPRGQVPLFANPKKHWVQRRLPLDRVGFNRK
ncbi:hypothetical protein [Nocardiopsis baichengensis]|uniref:hypothetical protein n=1 Tax=Nocardiopsis baichengensis TaxID=280240 RepID=UPI0003481ED7|nr:hypothetical protein [Nocardiopsis baichengensis]